MVTVREARYAAEEWAREQIEVVPELVGALLAGSTREREPDSLHPETSDVDVWVIVDAPVPDPVVEPESRFAFAKVHAHGVLLERAFFPWERMVDPERVLGDPHLAPNLAAPVLLADPSGRLERVAAAVTAAFPQRAHVRRRVEGALAMAATFCELSSSGAPPPPGFDPLVARSSTLLLGAAHAAAGPAVAALLLPTTRRAFVRSAEILGRHGRQDLAEDLLRALGSSELGRSQVERTFAELARAYDVAAEVRRTVFGLGYNVSREARELALGGVRELIDAGHHREAMFHLAFLRSLVQNAIENDAGEAARPSFREGYRELLSTLGMETDADHADRVAFLRALLPRIRAGCEEIARGTPGIRE